MEKETLKRRVGTFDLFAVGYGDLGSSIYYALGLTALFALGATPVALMLAGLVFVCTALTYAEMCSAFPEAGGSAAFTRHAFNDFVSFLAGWGLLLDYILTIAISAFSVPSYLSSTFDTFNLHFLDTVFAKVVTTIILIIFLLVLNIRGVREATYPSIILSFVTIVTQVLIVGIAAFYLVHIKDLIEIFQIGKGTALSPTWPQFWKGSAIAMVAYTGIESIAQLAAEAKNPTKIMPGAIKLTMFTLIVLYLGIACVALSAISPHELGTTYVTNPIAGITDHLPFGAKILTPWVGITAAIVLLIASNSGLIGASRLSYFMGQYYQIPINFYHLHPTYRTPYIALIFFGTLAGIIVVISRGQLMFLADLYNFGAMIAFSFAHLSLIVLRFKNPHLKRPYKVPLNIPLGKTKVPISAILGLIASVSVLFLIIITKPEGRYVGLGWMIIGTLMYFYYRRKKSLPALGRIKVESIKLAYNPFEFKKILVFAKKDDTKQVQIACEMAKLEKGMVYAVYVLEVPISIPFSLHLPQRMKVAEEALKKAEAIARENNINIELHIVHTRHPKTALINLVKKIKPDLFVLSSQDKKAISGPLKKYFNIKD